jgi:hypothetical protein
LPEITPDLADAAPPVVESRFDPLGWLQRNWQWLAGLLAAAATVQLGAMWWRKREAREPVVDFEPPVIVAPLPTTPAPPPPAAAAELPAPIAPPAQEGPLAITLEAVRLSATLLNTTLSYRITLSNQSRKTLGPVTISGDMIAAHASAPVEQQLGLDGAVLEQRHELPSLAPGETVSVKGDIRLALAAINPIKSGSAALFIPLARFQIAADQAKGEPLFLARTFVVGEAPEVADGGLRPFRLDLGPRIYARIAQREVMATY